MRPHIVQQIASCRPFSFILLLNKHSLVSVVRAYTTNAYCCRFFFFFFQAEDGIRDLTVTGVQTCALPISAESRDTLSVNLSPTGPPTTSALALTVMNCVAAFAVP